MAKGRDLRLNNVPGLTAYADGAVTLITTAADEKVVITDIMASTTGTLKEDSGNGDNIITIPAAGHSNLSSSIEVAEGADVFNDNPDMRVTVNYYLIKRS